MNNLTIREEKKRLVRKILKLVRPKMYVSGFVDKNNQGIKIWKSSNQISMPKNLVVKDLFGVTEDGIITDVWIGMVVQSWKSIPIEDLIRIRVKIDRTIRPVLFN